MRNNLLLKAIVACLCMMVVGFATDYTVIKDGAINKDKAESLISSWTEEDFTSHLSGEKRASWTQAIVHVQGDRASDHTFTECVDYYASEGSWRIYGYGIGYLTEETGFSASYECQDVTLTLDPGFYSFEQYDSYGDGGQDSYFDGEYVGSSSGSYSWIDVEATDPAPTCTDVTITVGGGSYDSEISWSIDGTDLAGAAGTVSACLEDGDYTFNMADSYGDGWNGAEANIYDADGNGFASGS